IQFSLLPKFKKMNEIFITSKTEKEIYIGIYHNKANPKELYPKAPDEALNKEGQRQHAILLYFISKNIKYKNKKKKKKKLKKKKNRKLQLTFITIKQTRKMYILKLGLQH